MENISQSNFTVRAYKRDRLLNSATVLAQRAPSPWTLPRRPALSALPLAREEGGSVAGRRPLLTADRYGG